VRVAGTARPSWDRIARTETQEHRMTDSPPRVTSDGHVGPVDAGLDPRDHAGITGIPAAHVASEVLSAMALTGTRPA
jgi:hypothetical protein